MRFTRGFMFRRLKSAVFAGRMQPAERSPNGAGPARGGRGTARRRKRRKPVTISRSLIMSAACLASLALPLAAGRAHAQQAAMSFFVTSAGSGKGRTVEIGLDRWLELDRSAWSLITAQLQ